MNREMVALCLNTAAALRRIANRDIVIGGDDWYERARYWIWAARDWRTS